jgi:hypothetical protein
VFPGAKGAPLRRSNFNKTSAWPYAVKSIGAEGLHVHDLRHTGNHFAASGGAGIKDLMARMGHDSERAAMIYQHTRHAARIRRSRALSTPTSRLSRPTMTTTTTAQRACSFRWANGPLMARKIKEGVRVIKAQAQHSGPDLGGNRGAGDENRIRTISLGIRPIHAAGASDQTSRATWSSRD